MKVEVRDQDQLRRYVAKQLGGQMTYQPRIPQNQWLLLSIELVIINASYGFRGDIYTFIY